MNKLLQLTTASLLVCGVSIGLPSQAEIIAATPSTIKTSSHTDTLRFTLQHSFNGNEQLSSETIEIPFNKLEKNPLVFLKTLKEHFSKLLEKQSLPVEIESKLDFVLSTKAIEALGKLPSISIKTKVNSDGSGKSDLVFPAYLRQVPEKFGKGGLIDWRGLDAEFTFVDKFENLNANVNIIGLLIEAEQKFKLSLGTSHLSGNFDSQFIPTQLDFDLNLPSLKIHDKQDTLNLNDFLFKLKSNKSQKGLDLGTISFQVSDFEITQQGLKTTIKGLSVSAKGEEQNGLINYKLHTKIDKLEVPTKVNIGSGSGDGFAAEIAFSSLDEETLLALQKQAQELKGKPQMAMMLLFQKLMEMSPKFLATSPKLAFKLKVDSSKGNFDGNIDIKLSGKEIKSLNLPALASLLQANANIIVNKTLLAQLVEAQILRKMQKSLADEKKTPSAEELAFLTKQAKQASEQQLQMFVGMKLLVDSGDGNYHLVAKFKDKKLNLNGKLMPFQF
jgi:hypothetical protein